jgi:Stigma-specific protein, Stig1
VPGRLYQHTNRPGQLRRVCVRTSTDPGNCGVCGRSCPGGYTCCDGNCVQTSTDPKNCGSCGKICPSGQGCCKGNCGWAPCGGQCCQPGATCVSGRDPTDPLDRTCRLLSGTTCDQAQLDQCLTQAKQDYQTCLSGCIPSDQPNCKQACNRNEYYAEASCSGQFGCLPGLGLCCPSGQCTHLSDTSNCGACGHACAPGEVCCSGSCTSLGTVSNCSSCGNNCPPGPSNSLPICTNGTCGWVCNPGFKQCGNACINVFGSDTSNCGDCNQHCPTPPNATATCNAGVCGFVCNYLPCGSACCPLGPPNSSPTCINGVCGWRCNAGLTQCGGQCVDTSSNTEYCGGCINHRCPTGWGCCRGVCTPLTTNQHCGDCSTSCTGSQTCVNGTCQSSVGSLQVTVGFTAGSGESCTGSTNIVVTGPGGFNKTVPLS